MTDYVFFPILIIVDYMFIIVFLLPFCAYPLVPFIVTDCVFLLFFSDLRNPKL
jgi:hypothetical protein